MIAVSYCVKFQGWNIGKLNAEEAIIMETQYEDCTPTWEETAHLLVHTLQCNPDNESARAELLRMGKIIDQQQRHIKEMRGAL